MLVTEGLELRFGPAARCQLPHLCTVDGHVPVKDPSLDAQIGFFGLVFALVPVALDLAEKTILVLLRAIRHALALVFEIGLKRVDIPVVVGR